MEPAVALAVGGHPDDIEFMMAGTLLLLKREGAEVHVWSMTDGSLGSPSSNRSETAALRKAESMEASRLAGFTLHDPVCPDMSLIYSEEMVARAAAVVREVSPSILFLPALDDYHPDHRNAAVVAAAAAFARGIAGFDTIPPVPPSVTDLTIYHALPFGLKDVMRARANAGQYVNVGEVMEEKRRMLGCHESQSRWLLQSQGMDTVGFMSDMCGEAGRDSGRFEYAEGWRRRLHLGYTHAETDPLTDVLGPLCWTDPAYEAFLQQGTITIPRR